MKPDWQAMPLGAVCNIVNGGTPRTDISEYWGGDKLWITPAEMGGRVNPYVENTERKITDSGLKNCSAQMLPINSVILSSRAPIGHLIINARPMATNQGCKGLIPGPQIYYKYLYYYLLSIVELLNNLGVGATFKELSASKLKEVEIGFPDDKEQRRIADILDRAFCGISAAESNVENSMRTSRALFEAVLEQSFTQENSGWIEKRLDEIGATITGSTPKSTEVGSYGAAIPFIKPGDFGSDGKLNYTTAGLSRTGRAQARIVGANSVLMVCIGATIGKCGYSDREVVTNQQINAFVPKDNLFFKFFYYQMKTQDFQSRVILNSGQATLPIINKSKWSALAVTFPSERDEQVRIATSLEECEGEVERLKLIYQKKLAALDELKKSLLHQAFSGNL